MSHPATSAPTPAPDRAPLVITVRGQQYFRRVGFVRANRLTCPLGHRVHRRAILREDGAVWCTHQERAGAPECGALLYLQVFPGLGHRHRVWAADVVMAELEHMEARRMTVDDVLAYLGGELSPVAEPAGGDARAAIR